MSPRRAAPVLALAVAACLPDNPGDTEAPATTTAGTDTGEPTGGPAAGLFACSTPPCTVVIVSQTLDDRIDVYDADTHKLRGRIDVDLKEGSNDRQLVGNQLDEPYELAITSTDLFVALGHYPDTDKGSLLRFPLTGFDAVEPGGMFPVADYFNIASGTFSGTVASLAHARLEGIFLLPHPGGRVLIGVFANNIKSDPTTWANPSELLVLDPADFSVDKLGSFDLGGLDVPCIGGWRLEALDPAVTKVAVACSGSESVAVLSLPTDFATAPVEAAAAGITGCGNSLLKGYVTQFVSADGAGGFLAVQSQTTGSPRLWHINYDCAPKGMPSGPPPEDLEAITLLRQPVLVRKASADADPVWLIAGGLSSEGVVVARGGGTPALCGRLGGLDILDSRNAPWALALDRTGDHLAIGAGPPNQPDLSDGSGQVLWGALDRAGIDTCELALTDTVDLNAGLFSSTASDTWVRAPNVVLVAELGGGA